MLPTDGDYLVRVYLMKPASRLPASQDAKVGKTPYHATAKVAFKYSLNPKVNECDGGVIRRGNDGTASVVLKSKAFNRSILFVKGKPVASDSAEEMKASKEGDIQRIEFGEGNEVYEINEAFVMGG